MSSNSNLQDHCDAMLENDNDNNGSCHRDAGEDDDDIEERCENDAYNNDDDMPLSSIAIGATTPTTGAGTTTATTIRLPCGREVDAKNTCQSHSLVRLEEEEPRLHRTVDDIALPQSHDSPPVKAPTTMFFEGHNVGMVQRPHVPPLSTVHLHGTRRDHHDATSTIGGGRGSLSVITTDAANIESSNNNSSQNDDTIAVVARMATHHARYHHPDDCCCDHLAAPFATARILGSHVPSPAVLAVQQLDNPELIPVPFNEDSVIVPPRDPVSSSEQETIPNRTDRTLPMVVQLNSPKTKEHPTNERRRRTIVLISLAIAAGVVLLSGIVSTAVICSVSTACTIGGANNNSTTTTALSNNNTNSSTTIAFSPTMAPTSVQALPSDATNQTRTNRTAVFEMFINSVTFTGREIKLRNDTQDKMTNLPAEELSLLWLVDQDQLQLWPDSAINRFRLVQRYAMLTLWYQQLTSISSGGTTTWTNTSGWTLVDNECTWYGIQCEWIDLGPNIGPQKTVTHINLQQNNLFGTLSPELGLLSNLIGVNVSTNHLSGSIPSSLQHWSHLEIFDGGGRGYGSNAFSNPNLETVMSRWSKMRFFSYSSNGVESGSLPSMVGTWWPELEHFDIYYSGFTGALPSSMGNWSRLTSLTLSDNAFTGSLPNWIGQWTNLQNFDISYCTFASGTIPEIVGRWSHITRVNLRNNAFTGTLPESIGNWTNLLSLDMDDNGLQGTLPGVVQKWTKVQSITASANALNGSIPSGLESWTDLDHVDLSKNHFTGSLPVSIGAWTKVRNVFLHGNYFLGSLPATWAAWTSIEYLSASRNMLTGHIPDYVGNWTNIRDVLLSDNALTGTLPASMSRWTLSLGSLVLYSNLLSGTLPDYIGSWTLIRHLQLQSNAFSGTLPNVVGTIPESVVSWSMIQSVRFFDNSFNRSVASAFCSIRDVQFAELAVDCSAEATCACCTYCL